ncbi:MAG: hypothetical protein ACJ74D_10175 [Gaiellaceae bacterium]
MSSHSPAFEKDVIRVSRRLAGRTRGSAWFDPPRRFRTIEREAHHLHEVERVGESEWTPWIAILGLVLFFVPVLVLMTALTFAAAHLAQ